MGKMRLGRDSTTPVTRQMANTAPAPIFIEKLIEVPVEVIVYEDREVVVDRIVEVVKEVIVEKIVPFETIREVIVEKLVPDIKYVDRAVVETKIVKVHDIEPVLRAQDINRKLERKNAMLKLAIVALTLICIGIGVARG